MSTERTLLTMGESGDPRERPVRTAADAEALLADAANHPFAKGWFSRCGTTDCGAFNFHRRAGTF